jgi:hypothetical protein
MAARPYNLTLINQQVDGTALTNTTTATSLLPTQAKYTLAPNWDFNVGSKLKIVAGGRMSTVVTTPGTLTFEVRFGTTVVVFSGGAMALNVVAKTNVTWELNAELTVRAIATGVNSTIYGRGKFMSEAVIGSPVPGTGGSGLLLLPATSPGVGSSFDNSLTTNTVDLYATWSVANASNSIRCDDFELVLAN